MSDDAGVARAARVGEGDGQTVVLRAVATAAAELKVSKTFHMSHVYKIMSRFSAFSLANYFDDAINFLQNYQQTEPRNLSEGAGQNAKSLLFIILLPK